MLFFNIHQTLVLFIRLQTAIARELQQWK